MRRLPSKIREEPWIDASLEIRFTSALNGNEVFRRVYDVLGDSYPNVTELPTLRIPDEIKRDDVRFFEKPDYRIQNDTFNVQIGPNTISVHCNDPKYPGWTVYSNEINRVLTCVENQSVVDNVTRVGIRYINFLPYSVNIFNDLRLNISHSGRVTTELPASVRFNFQEDNDFLSTLQIANYVEAQKGEESVIGSIIDIDTYRTESLDEFFSCFSNLVEEAHSIAKAMFFGLFTDDYLESLNPEYNDEQD